MKKAHCIGLFLLIGYNLLLAQFLQNPSFEGAGVDNQAPELWQACKGSPDNPPFPDDILIELPASDGDKYLSLRARGDIPHPDYQHLYGVNDKVSGQLIQPLVQYTDYMLEIDLATDFFVEYFWVDMDMDTIQLQLFAGNSACDSTNLELLAESGPIYNTDWETYSICFAPQNNSYNYFLLAADFVDDDTVPGILLIDNLHIQAYRDYEIVSMDTTVMPGSTIELTASGSGDYYNWIPAEGLSCANCATTNAFIENNTSYHLQWANHLGCEVSEVFNIEVFDCSEIATMFSRTVLDTMVEYNASLELRAPEAELFFWQPAENLSCSDCQNTQAQINSSTEFICFATDAYGCEVEYRFNIQLELEIPNVITPNNDGVNENFVIPGLPSGSKLKLLDRTGRLIYETADYDQNWPGNHAGDLRTETETYWYLIEAPGYAPFQGYLLVKFP